MKTFTNHPSMARLCALGVVFCVALMGSPASRAQDVTSKTLVDRAQIQDLITRYYYNFGTGSAESFSDFYADDAELSFGTKHFKGKDGIAKMYAGLENPMAKAFAFNITVSNTLIVVHGAKATAQLIYTEFLVDKEGDAPHSRSQGREYATFVKANGKWRYKTREITGGIKPPEGWKE